MKMQDVEAQTTQRGHQPPIQRLRVERRGSAQAQDAHAVDSLVQRRRVVIRNDGRNLDASPSEPPTQLFDDGFDASAIRGVVFADVEDVHPSFVARQGQ
jgi:hypothetical protein